MNADRYSVSLRIQSKCGKMRTGKHGPEKTRYSDTFDAVSLLMFLFFTHRITINISKKIVFKFDEMIKHDHYRMKLKKP